MDDAIKAIGLGRRFGHVTAVEDVHLSVGPGEVLALLGPNGAGKTTTMQMIAALLAPTTGTAVVAGFNVRDHPQKVRERVGIMLDEPGFYPDMTVEKYLLFFGCLYGVPARTVRSRLQTLLEIFGLLAKRSQSLDTLSKGMRQKVSLIRALLHEPPVLLLDEPTSALDPLSARAVHRYIAERKRAGVAIILSTHNLPEAELLADRLAIVARGRVWRTGGPQELRRANEDAEGFALRWAGQRDGHVAALEGLFPLLNVVSHESAGDDHVVVYRTESPRQANSAAVSLLVERGAQVTGLEQRQRSLHDIYLSVMEEAEG